MMDKENHPHISVIIIRKHSETLKPKTVTILRYCTPPFTFRFVEENVMIELLPLEKGTD